MSRNISKDILCDRSYGEVLITQRNTAALHCLLCPLEERSYQKFLQHIFGHHYIPPSQTPNVVDESTLTNAINYGEVIITTRNTDLLRCLVCRKEERSYQKFLEHIFAHHYEMAADQNSDVNQCESADDENDTEEELVSECSDSETVERNEQGNASESSSHSLVDPVNTIKQIMANPFKTDKELLEERTCPICKKIYKDKGIMRVHLKRHSGIKPFACKLCNSKFYTRVEVRLHLRSHNNERPFVCSFCGATFRVAERLYMHERMHRDERPFKCTHCDKAFYDHLRLKDHLLVHIGEKNFECSVCKTRFVRKKTLSQHMKLHANERQYKCELCDETFNQMPALFSHKKNRHKLVTVRTTMQQQQQTSEEEGLLMCELCNVGFGTKTGLLVHCKQMHTDDVVTTSTEIVKDME